MQDLRILLTLLGLCLCIGMSAQPLKWVEMMQDPNAKFEETVKEFDAWWGDREVTKGSGWKPFQRWKYYMESRVAPDGTQSGPLLSAIEFERYMDEYKRRAGSRSFVSATADWTEVGPQSVPSNSSGQPNGAGRLSCLTFHPTDANTLFAGAPAGGIWKSTDYGSTWSNLSGNLDRLGVSSIVIHPSDPQTIYVGMGDRDAGDAPGRGVWRSTDGGTTWSSWNSGMGNRTVYEILMHPSNPDILIASTNNRIYRSTNGGANWNQVFSGSSNKDLAFHPTNPDIVYASGNTVFRSTDNGQSWTHVTNGAPNGVWRIALAVSEDTPNNVYLLSGSTPGFEGFYRSTDSGASFTLMSNSPNICGYDTNGGDNGNQTWFDLVAIGDPNDGDHIIIGAINIWETFDGGSSWSIVSHWYGGGGNPAIHADQHVLEYSPHTGDLFAGHDGGLHYSTNGGNSFTQISSGLGISQIYKLGQSATEKDLTIVGFQDNGSAIRDNGSWRTELGGDGMECAIDYTDSDVLYGTLYYGEIYRSQNRGSTFLIIAANGINGIDESGNWVTPYKLHPSNPDTMYAGYKNVWRSFNCKSAPAAGVNWTQISSFSGNNNDIIDLDVSKSDPDVMYVSREGSNRFYRSNNVNAGSPSWTNLSGNLPASGSPRDIEISPTDPTKLWIALGNNIYESTDSGVSWTDISGTLPNISLNSIVAYPGGTTEVLYVGMDVGVYYYDNTQSDWLPYLDQLPNTEVTELEIYVDPDCPSESLLKASTFGRGLWETPLYFAGNQAPEICFTASILETCSGESIFFTDESVHDPTSWTWSITPNTFTFEGGTNANSQNPEVVFSAAGFYDVSLTATNTHGSNTLTRSQYINITSDPIILPYVEDLESFGLCGTNSNCGGTVCPLGNGWLNLTNGIDDDIDWRVDEDGTPSDNTGPSVDANPGTSAGNYVYLEASNGCTNQTAEMVSPCIDLTSAASPTFSFAYHMNGNAVGSLHIDILADGVWTEDITPAISGNQGNSWQTREVALSAYTGKVVMLKIRGTTGSGWQSDIAVDDIQITDDNACLVTSMNDSGQGTLRECIDNASDGIVVAFDQSFQDVTITLTSGVLAINNNLTITASPSKNITISGASLSRVFEIANSINVTMEGINLISGTNVEGRGILNDGTLVLNNIDIEDNPSSPGTGNLVRNNGNISIEGICNIND